MKRKADFVNTKRGGEFCGFILLLILIAIPMISAKAQNAGQVVKDKRDADCIKVSLTSDSNRLQKEHPAIVKVKVQNSCNRMVEILEPVFYLDRVSDKTEPRAGYAGRIIRKDASKIDNTVKPIRGGGEMAFALHFNEVRWMDSMSSIDVFQDLFEFANLPSGEYIVFCTVAACQGCNAEQRNVRSNNVKMTLKKLG